MLTFALAKGRLAEETMARLRAIGITCDEMDEISRKLIFYNHALQMKFFLAKPSDVPTYVEYGAADIGIVGKDTLLEEKRDLYEVFDFKSGVFRIVEAGLHNRARPVGILRVATKYPAIAADYFDSQGITIELIKLSGSVELAPIVGLADVIVDIVSTGATLKENGLVEIAEICSNLSARMIVNRVSMKMEYKRITAIIQKLKDAELVQR